MICLYGRTLARSACSLQIIRSLSSSALPNGGKVDAEMRLHEEHSSQASTPTRSRQFMAFANSSAKSFLPIPSSPVKSREPGTRPLVSKRRRLSFTSSLPIRVENIREQRARSKVQSAIGWPCTQAFALSALSRALAEMALRSPSLTAGFPELSLGRQSRARVRAASSRFPGTHFVRAHEIQRARDPADRCAWLQAAVAF